MMTSDEVVEDEPLTLVWVPWKQGPGCNTLHRSGGGFSYQNTSEINAGEIKASKSSSKWGEITLFSWVTGGVKFRSSSEYG